MGEAKARAKFATRERSKRPQNREEHAYSKRGAVHELLEAAGLALKERNYEAAWELAQAALSKDMDSAGSHYVVGQIALAWDYPGLAAAMLRRACALRPDVYSNWLGFGAALLDMRHFDAAEECFKKAIKISPNEMTGYGNMSALELNRGRPRESIEWAEKALTLVDNPGPHANIGFAALMLKDWARGADEYRASMVSGKHRVRRIYRVPEEPDWDGTPGRTVVVQTEQGIGDEISFASMLPDMIRDCKKVVIDSHPKLENLFRRSFPQADVYGTRKKTGLDWPKEYEIDASIPMSSLMAIYRRRDEDFPRTPWLVPCPEKRAKWREWLAQYPGVKCGLAWTGGIFITNREGRSIKIEDMRPILQDGTTYVCLEYRDFEFPVRRWNQDNPERKIVIPPVDQEDYDDTVALLAELDHVISVTTTIVHACGALGRSCWCIVPSVLTSSQWRYGIEGDEMLWYPPDSVRLYRQFSLEEDMTGVIDRVASDWRARLA